MATAGRQLKWDGPFLSQQGIQEIAPANSGIQFENVVTKEQVSRNRVLINGSGVAAGDINNDGLTDVYFANIDGNNALYLNQGNWKFQDVTQEAGTGLSMDGKYSTGVAFADIDGDSDLDLIVTTLANGNTLFINDGEGNFTQKSNPFPGSEKYGSHSIAISDIEKDGDLDIYITNYKARSAKDIYPTKRMFDDIVKQEGDEFSIREQFKDHYVLEERGEFVLRFETGESDLLYINDGKGNFTKKTMDSGIFKDQSGNAVGELKDWGLHAKFFDINDDGYQDLYVCNDFESPDRIWINQKDGTFKALERTAVRHTSLSSMSVDNADLNKDGSTDIFIAEMLAQKQSNKLKHLGTMIPLPEPVGAIENRPQYVGNTLMLNRGDATFSNITDYAGVKSSNWTWGSIFADVDLDGHEDIIITNGNYYDSQDLDANNELQRKIAQNQIDPTQVMLQYPSLEQTNIVFKNNGDLTFSDKSADWGFEGKDISQGLATADFDNDGDLDLVMNRLNGKAGLFKNTTRADRIGVRLIGDSTNTQAIGSTIEVTGGIRQSKEVSGGGTYLSSSEQIYSFAASSVPISIKITWYDGTVSTIDNLQANRIYEFSKSDLSAQQPKESDSNSSGKQPLFVDKSELFGPYSYRRVFQ
ncbi:MAG: CRTAC1 family protein [Balneolaceae bacterium]|nr:CRTAC1 family protein [Balneolaceae bacterium]